MGAPHGNFPGGTNLTRIESSRQDDNGTQDNTGLVYQCPVVPGECGPIGDGNLPVFDGTGTHQLTMALNT